MAQRKHGDIAAILALVQATSYSAMFAHRGHHDCTNEFCEFADENSTIKSSCTSVLGNLVTR